MLVVRCMLMLKQKKYKTNNIWLGYQVGISHFMKFIKKSDPYYSDICATSILKVATGKYPLQIELVSSSAHLAGGCSRTAFESSSANRRILDLCLNGNK